MDWSIVAALAEVAGAIAVVASLIYVAAQIRQNSRALEAASVESVLAAHREIYHPICMDPETFDLVWRGSMDLDSLDARERPRFMWLAFNMLKTMEDFHYKHETGLLADEIWQGWSTMFSSFLEFPGMRSYWSLRRAGFSESFAGWVDTTHPDERFAPTHVAAAVTLNALVSGPDAPKPGGQAIK